MTEVPTTQTNRIDSSQVSSNGMSETGKGPSPQPVVDSKTLKTDVQKLGEHLKSDSQELVEDVKAFAKTQVINPVIAKAQDRRTQVSLRAREAEVRVRQRADEAKRVAGVEYQRSLQKVREKPLAAIAIAALAGAILGRFLLRK